MNQKILSVLIIVFSSFQLFSQNHLVEYFDCITCNAGNHDNINMVFEYSDDPIEFLTEHVMSDYGPRDSGVDHYDWHGGIDYSSEAGNADFGDGIVSILGGTVQSIGRNRYKYVFVDGDDENDGIAYDFGYGHLFQSNITNQKSGNFFWQEVIGMPGNYAIIIDENTALFTQAGRHVIYPPTGEEILTVNQVVEGQMIGPIGNSISFGALSAHLHLYLFEDNQFGTDDQLTKNPLQFVNHEIPNYNVEVLTVEDGTDPMHVHLPNSNNPITHPNWYRFGSTDINAGFLLEYPGTSEQQILAKVTMSNVDNGNSYDNAVSNIEKIDFLIGDNILNYSVISGPNFSSSLMYGGVLGEERNPNNYDDRGQAQQGRTGMQPWMYSDRRQRPFDFFNFADFVTRIHRDDDPDEENTPTRIADTPDMARYNDGVYQIKAVVTDVRGNEHEGPKNADDELEPIEFTLDNFMPYLQNVIVVFGTTIYSKNVNSFDPSTLQIDNGYVDISGAAQTATSNGATQNLTIVVRSSEPLDPATVTFSNPDLAPIPIPSTGHSGSDIIGKI